jgi:uncharacterized protein (DUF1684 family)
MNPPDVDPHAREALEKELEIWRAARVKRLTSESGWLTLIGRFWLKPGQNRLGSDPSSEVVFPAGRAPAWFANIHLQDGVARLEALPGVELTSAGRPVTSLELHADDEPNPDTIALGTLTFQLLRRGEDLAIRVRDRDNPARRNFPGIPCYPTNPAWRVVAKLEPYTPHKRLELEYGTGAPEVYFSPGRAVFEVGGVVLSLDPVIDQGRDRLFVLFTDDTSADATYPAGRFLYTPTPVADGVVLDFNQAFNPPCAFTPYAVCPLPPPQNRLPIRVEAGEKRPHE